MYSVNHQLNVQDDSPRHSSNNNPSQNYQLNYDNVNQYGLQNNTINTVNTVKTRMNYDHVFLSASNNNTPNPTVMSSQLANVHYGNVNNLMGITNPLIIFLIKMLIIYLFPDTPVGVSQLMGIINTCINPVKTEIQEVRTLLIDEVTTLENKVNLLENEITKLHESNGILTGIMVNM